MPYVNDRSSYTWSTVPFGNGSSTATVATGMSRAQFGFRSGARVPLTEAPPPDLPKVVHGPTSRTTLQRLESAEVYFTSRMSDGWQEHDRTYDEIHLRDYSYAGFRARRKSAPPGEGYINHPKILCSAVAPVFFLASPRDGEVSRAAESLYRSSVPERPYTNVARTLGELKDAPQLMAVANYVPRSTKDLGGAYLNQVFGTQPTVGDMQRLGEAVHGIIPAVRDEVSGCSELIHARRSMKFASDSGTVTAITASASTPVHLGSNRTGVLDVWGMRGGGDIQLVAGISYHETISLDTYGRFERAVVRMDSMNRTLGDKLRPLLGSGLSADVIYDLTPYTWLLNWVWDFGSILRYQEALNGSDVVAKASGYTLRQEKQVGWSVGFRENPNGSLFELTATDGAFGGASRRRDRRQGGLSPYSLTTGSWDTLSNSQWAVLAAMGLARGPGVPIIRNTSRSAVYRDHRASRRAGARNRYGN